MLDASAAHVTVMQLLPSVDAAATANATSAAGIDVSEYEGFLICVQNAGILDAGTLDGTIITSDNSNLSDPTTIGTFTQVTTSTDPKAQSIAISSDACKKYIGYVGTIATGGALVGCVAVGQKKYL